MANVTWIENCSVCSKAMDVIAYDDLIRLTHDWVTYNLCGWKCAHEFTGERAPTYIPSSNTGVILPKMVQE